MGIAMFTYRHRSGERLFSKAHWSTSPGVVGEWHVGLLSDSHGGQSGLWRAKLKQMGCAQDRLSAGGGSFFSP